MNEQCRLKSTKLLAKEFFQASPEKLIRNENWHLIDQERSFGRLLHGLFHRKRLWENSPDSQELEQMKIKLLDFFVTALAEREIWLGEPNNDNISDRLDSIDKIIIHHTAGDNQLWLMFDPISAIQWLNSLQFLRLSAYYRSYPLYNQLGELVYPNEYEADLNLGRFFPNIPGLEELSGVPNFIQYHILIFPDGKAFQINSFEELLWNAPGANETSVSVVLIGNLNLSEPSHAQLDSLARVVVDLQTRFTGAQWLGHREVIRKDSTPNPTDCPGDTYLKIWKSKLGLRSEQLRNV